jgi:hypothetical protein
VGVACATVIMPANDIVNIKTAIGLLTVLMIGRGL